MQADKPSTSNVPERKYRCGITGTGAADPTKRYGDGITVTRTSAGVYKFTFASQPGYWRGMSAMFGASTPTDMGGHSATYDDYVPATSSANAYVEVTVTDDTPAADDLEALEYLDVVFVFSEISTS